MIRAVLFDIDGTLVDSNEEHVKAWAFAFRAAGRALEEEDIRMQIGKGGDLLIPTLLPDATDDEREAIDAGHGDNFKSLYLDGVRPFPAAADLVRRAHAAGLKTVLASSATAKELEHYIGLLGIADVVDATTSIDDVETSKPAPDIFGVALEKAGVAPAEAIVVGDTVYDVEAAAKAGVAAIGLTSGPFDEPALREAGAIAVHADAADLLARFDRSPLGLNRSNTGDAA